MTSSSSPLPPPASGLTALTLVFSDLSVPLSKEKIQGSSTSIPSAFWHPIFALNCPKCQLLYLLGALSFAFCILPQGQAFISHLLSVASSLLSLLTPISLDSSGYAKLTYPLDTSLFTDAALSRLGCFAIEDGLRGNGSQSSPELREYHVA